MLARLGYIGAGAQRVILIALCAVLYGLWLQWMPLTEIDEVRYSAATQAMIRTDDYIIPTFNDAPRYQKPILYYWVQAASVRTFQLIRPGADFPAEPAARFPGAAATLLLVLLVHAFLLRWLPARGAAFLGALGMATTLFCLIWGRAATTDAVLTLCISAALLAMLQAELVRVADPQDDPRAGRWWYVAAGAAAGLAFLTKGPMGLAIPGLAWLLYHARGRSLRREAPRVPWPAAVGAFTLVAAPWYIATWFRVKTEFLAHFFGTENVQRFSSTMEGHGGANLFERLVYYPCTALWLLFPLSIFLLHELCRPFAGDRQLRADPVLMRLRRFGFAWLFATFGLFALSHTQLPSYVQSVAGAAGLLFALHALGRLRREGEAPAPRLPGWAAGLETAALAVFGGLIAAALALVMHDGKASLFGLTLDIGRAKIVSWAIPAPYPPDQAGRVALLLLVIGGLFVLGVLGWGAARRAGRLLGWTLAGWTLLMIVTILFAAPMVVTSNYADMARAGMSLPRDTPVAAYYDQAPESLVYYARRRVELLPQGAEGDAGLRALLADNPTVVVVTNVTGYERLRGLGHVLLLRRMGGVLVVQLAAR